MTRPNWFHVSAEGARALGELHTYATTGTNLSDQLVHLVFLRVSQLNGCAHCIDIHTRDLIKGGMTVDKLVLVPVWEEASYLFSEQERAALAWSEEVTLVSETHASDEAYAAALATFGEKGRTHDCDRDHERLEPHGHQLPNEAARQGLSEGRRLTLLPRQGGLALVTSTVWLGWR